MGGSNELCHSSSVVFASGTLIPWIVANKEVRAQFVKLFSLQLQLTGSSRQVPKKVPLVAPVNAKGRPGWPNTDKIVSPVKHFTSFHKLFQVKFPIGIVIEDTIPSHNQVGNIGMANPMEILSFQHLTVKFAGFHIV